MVKPLIFSIVALTVVMISTYLFELTDFIIVQQVPFLTVMELLFYKLPTFMVETFSISLLFATLFSLGRMVADNEYAALRLAGYNLPRLILPLLFIALVVSSSVYLINEQLAPWTNHRARNIIRQSIRQDPAPHLQEDVFFKGPENRFFYVGEVDEREQVIKQVVIYTLDDGDGYPQLITAPRGTFRQDLWELEEGVIHNLTEEGRVDYETSFQQLEVNVGGEVLDFYGRQRTPSEMSRQELAREIELFSRSGINVSSLLVEYHMKLALPLASFIFVIIGAPLSLISRRSRAAGLVACVVAVLIYYVLVSVSRSLGRNQMLSPIWAAWLPNLIFACLGFILIFRQEFLRFR